MASNVQRLNPDHAADVVDCFQRVYGDSYANGLFYDTPALREAMAQGRIYCVGAFADNLLVAHMAMTIPHTNAHTAELGNTVVDPNARGGGLAWQVGDALTSWCRSLGYTGFLHYPTTDHHIMQRQSVKGGFETGLMLSYIPAQTDGGVRDRPSRLRQAATVVYQPLAQSEQADVYCPNEYEAQLAGYANDIGLARTWLTPPPRNPDWVTEASIKTQPRRGLTRLHVARMGHDFSSTLAALETDHAMPCLQLDLCMDDAHIDAAAQTAKLNGYVFCAWLPGFAHTDVLRLQKVDVAQTELAPEVVNPTAQALLAQLTRVLG